MSKVMLDSTAIQKIIPHRYPMLLIDRVEELVPGEMAVAKRNVTINEAVFNGHFGGIESAEFRKVVRPGDTMRLEVHLEKVRGHIGLGKGVATVDGKRACTAELTFFID